MNGIPEKKQTMKNHDIYSKDLLFAFGLVAGGILLSICTPCPAQERYQIILQEIEKNNTSLKMSREEQKVKELESRTAIYPDNPEIGFGNTWGNGSTGGNTQEITVSQTIDFPTLYWNRNKLAKCKSETALQEYRIERMNLLLSAKEICVQMTYYNALVQMYQKQANHAQQIAQAEQRRKETGEGNAIQFNKARLNCHNMENLLTLNCLELERLHMELIRLNGGQEIIFQDTLFPIIRLPENFEDWYQAAKEEHPAIGWLESRLTASQEEVKVNRSHSLPKISLGYSCQLTGQENFNGISVGLSIPLWENRNQVKKAKAQAISDQYKMNDACLAYHNEMKSYYNQAITLQKAILSYKEFLQENSNADLLYRAFRTGELSLLEYLLELDYYFDIYEKYLSMQKDLALLYARMTSFQL